MQPFFASLEMLILDRNVHPWCHYGTHDWHRGAHALRKGRRLLSVHLWIQECLYWYVHPGPHSVAFREFSFRYTLRAGLAAIERNWATKIRWVYSKLIIYFNYLTKIYGANLARTIAVILCEADWRQLVLLGNPPSNSRIKLQLDHDHWEYRPYGLGQQVLRLNKPPPLLSERHLWYANLKHGSRSTLYIIEISNLVMI